MKCPKCHANNPDTLKFCGECGAKLDLSFSGNTAGPGELSSFTKTLETNTGELTRGMLFAGRYEIISPIGGGGMGEVFRARDTRLGREIALKVLPEELSLDRERLIRFEQEARLASSLNHPNIVTIYEVGQQDSIHYIAMELVEGKALRENLAAGPLSLQKVLDIAVQVAEGLTKAHEAGIVHRDLKPENLMITTDGFVKILDFGLGKLVPPVSRLISQMPTMTLPGTILGTIEYMSPEQASGREVDFRSDQFSFGLILYEMVTGKRAFQRETAVQTLSATIENEPEPIAMLNPKVPAPLIWIVERCLSKELKGRYTSTRDLTRELQSLRAHLSEAPAKALVTPRPRVRARHIWIAAFALALLVLVGVGFYLLVNRSKSMDSVAVLPFANESGDANMEYLSDGITEALINNLSELSNLRVIARSSVFRYKGQEIEPQKVGPVLKVRAIVTGRVIQRGDILSISAELIDARDNRHLWGEKYDRRPSDILALQEEISRGISEKLRLRLSSKELKRLTKRYTKNTEAYQAYLMGRYYWNKRTEEGLKKGIEYFERALEEDPGYALAYAGLADSYIILGTTLYLTLSPTDAFPRAKSAAMKAIGIDDTLAEAHTSLAFAIFNYDWDWSGAEREYKRAIEINPNYPTVHAWYAMYLQATGRLDKAIAEIKRAQELDPLSVYINAIMGRTFYWARQYNRAIEQLRETLEIDPNYYPAHLFMGMVYEHKGMHKEAIAEFQAAINLSGSVTLAEAALGHAYAVSGKRDEAMKILTELNKLSKKKYMAPVSIALIYAGLGETEQAFEWLGKAYEDRDNWMAFLKVEPMFDSIRSDPRFTDLLRRIGLEK